jgi:hypothetical protein
MVRVIARATLQQIQDRLRARARYLSRGRDQEVLFYQQFFRHANILGDLLHQTREYLDIPYLYPPDSRLPAGAILWLWEHGLMLPDEISNGDISLLIDWYTEQSARLLAGEIAPSLSAAQKMCTTLRNLPAS